MEGIGGNYAENVIHDTTFNSLKDSIMDQNHKKSGLRIVLTGMSGFVAPHLARYLSKATDAKIYGTVRNRSEIGNIPVNVEIAECELTDSVNVDDVIGRIKPDYIFHLAAQSFVKTSWISPADTLTNNIISELNVLEAVRKYVPGCVVHIAGSSEEYGNPIDWPIKENHPLNPLSPYGVSKVTQEKLGYQYHKSYGLKVVLTRAFNHTGPGRDTRFAEASFAKQIAEGNTVKVGNLDAVRDYTDVRDTVRAYWLAATMGDYGVPYNICNDSGITMRNLLLTLISISGREVHIVTDPDRMRPSDIQVLIGDSTKFREATGWRPEYGLEQTLTDLYRSFI